jgi:hypothetical protein
MEISNMRHDSHLFRVKWPLNPLDAILEELAGRKILTPLRREKRFSVIQCAA